MIGIDRARRVASWPDVGLVWSRHPANSFKKNSSPILRYPTWLIDLEGKRERSNDEYRWSCFLLFCLCELHNHLNKVMIEIDIFEVVVRFISQCR